MVKVKFAGWLPLFVAALFVSQAWAQNVRPLTILHSNDLHAHLLPDDKGVGGFAYLATVVREERAKNPASTLYLNAGDLVQGTPVSTIYEGVPIYEIANRLGIDVGTLGNHEFDYGWRRVQQFARIAKYPVVSANVVNERGTPITGDAFTIKLVGGIRVAVIGAVLGDLVGTYATADRMGPWKALPVVETVRRYVKEVKDKSDIIILLGHVHDDEADEVLKQIPEVSVAIVGHKHEAYPKLHNFEGRVSALVTSYGAELGRLDLQVDLDAHKLKSAEWKIIPIDSKKIAPDPKIAHEIEQWEAKVSKIVDVPIGAAKRAFTKKEMRLIVEQAMADQTGAEFAWTNEGNIRSALPAGTIMARAIWNMLPFDNVVVTGRFKGSQLPAKVRAEHPDIDPNREYTLAVTDFTAANQASEDQFGVGGLVFPKTGRMQRDMVINWIKEKKALE